MAPLIAIALNTGFPMIRSILERKLGDKNGALVTDVLGAMASRAGVRPDELEKLAEENPGKIIDAMREVEKMTPELIALYEKGLEHQFALLEAEMAEGGWKASWRPAFMWFLMFLWAWQVVLLHVANAFWKIALPPMPWEHLLGLTAIFMGLYMGGHTVKDAFAKMAGAGK